MNQILKNVIYSKGTSAQVDYIATIGGMNEQEKQFLQMTHDGKTDLYIQNDMAISKNGIKRIEESVRSKLAIAIFSCITRCMMEDK